MEFIHILYFAVGFVIAWAIAFLYWLYDQKGRKLDRALIQTYRNDIEYLEDYHSKVLEKSDEQEEQLLLITKENSKLSAALDKRQLVLIERDNQIRNFAGIKTEFEKKQEGLREELFKKTEQNDFLHQQLESKNLQLQKFEGELANQMTLNAQIRLQKNDEIPNDILTVKNQEIAELHKRLSVLLPLESERVTLSNQISELLLQRTRLQGFISDKDNEIQQINLQLNKYKTECEECEQTKQQLISEDRTSFFEQKIIDKNDKLRLLTLELDDAKEKIANLEKSEINQVIENKEIEISEDSTPISEAENNVTDFETVEENLEESLNNEVIDSVEKKFETSEVTAQTDTLEVDAESEEVMRKKKVTLKEEVLDNYETENIEIKKVGKSKKVKADKDSSAKVTDLTLEKVNLVSETVLDKSAKNSKIKEKVEETEKVLEIDEKTNATIIEETVETKEIELLEIAEESTTKSIEIKAENLSQKAEIKTEKDIDETVKVVAKVSDEEADEAETVEMSPVFKELAEPKLPQLPSENRAKLQLQSPTRIFFYWSLKDNPYQPLQKIFGNQASDYILVVKLIDLKKQSEEFYPIETKGSWWFDVESDGNYRAEIGFFSPNRPFIRLMYSNDLETPRLSPSQNVDLSPTFAVTAMQFAESLDVSGYKQDAVEVVMMGDNVELGDEATENSYREIVGKQEVTGVSLGEIRFALVALASGIRLDALREMISPQLFAELNQNYGNLSVENIIEILERNFGITLNADESETVGEKQQKFSYAVFGLSLINFPQAYSSFNVAKK
jgi:hypothetical protein